jgi:hypothetical protein
MRPFPHFPPSFLRSLLASFSFCGALALTTPASAQTADGQTPAQERVCDSQSGALWGLCVSYCEAMDCDYTFPPADDSACDHVLGNYLKKANGALPPCEEIATPE